MTHNRPRRGGTKAVEEQLPPVKWINTSGSPRSENGQGLDRWERLLHKMEFFTIDLIKEGDRSLGMVIVSGKVRNKDGSTVEGIFMQKILPGSLTDKDGRIQAGDMLVEINGTSMVGGTVDLASKKLRDSRDSVKLKVGRPDRGAFKVPGDDEKEPIYVNSVEDSELQTKLEEAEARATKMEELRHKAEKDLKVIREMADKEQKTFHKKLEEAEEKQEAHKKDAQAKISDLTIALANITVEKTKLEKEVESLKFSQSSHSSGQDGEISSLKRQLKESESERDMAERDLQQLRQEKEANVGFHYRLSELESDRAHTRQERDAIRRQLESTCHELSVAHATLKQMQIEKTALQEENERVSLELERGRKSSTGRMNTEAELVRKKRELSSVLREMQALRDEKERVEKDVVEVRREMEKEKQRNSELQKKLDSQKKEEKTSMGELLSRLQAQAKQIHDLKEELKPQSVSETAVAAGLVAGVREDQREQVGEADETEADKQIGGKPNSVGTAPVEDKPSSSPEITLSKSPEPLLAQSPKRSSPEKSSPGKEGKSPKQHLTAKESISIESFDAVKPTAVLDNTAAKDKTQVALRNAKQHRNRPSREYIRSMSTENLLISPSLEDIANETLPTEKAPVPRPRRPTLEKDSQAHKPSPVPRHLRSPVPPPNDPPQRPPKPSSPQTESERGGQASPDRKKKVATPKPESRGGRMSPPHTRAPSPKPQPTPRRMTKRSDDPPADDAQPKDPSQLSVKERMELAQKAMVKKPPPVIPKKPSSRVHTDDPAIPKSLSQPEAEETELPETRYSYDNELSPRPVKRLPPGAFNIGLLGMTPFGVARQRSNTVATSRDHSQDRDTDDDCREQIQKEAESDVGSSEVLDTDDVEIKLPPKRPPLPTKRTLSNEKPLHLSTRNNDALDEAPPPSAAASDSIDPRMETDGGDSPILQAGPHGTLPDPSELDYDQVLTWSPTQVASWMNRIGVSQHAKVFLDRGVQGNKLFDMDGAALKAMGVFSQEDRATIKREIRALRPHAEKQKRVLDKQRKDDKKKKKRHFV